MDIGYNRPKGGLHGVEAGRAVTVKYHCPQTVLVSRIRFVTMCMKHCQPGKFTQLTEKKNCSDAC